MKNICPTCGGKTPPKEKTDKARWINHSYNQWRLQDRDTVFGRIVLIDEQTELISNNSNFHLDQYWYEAKIMDEYRWSSSPPQGYASSLEKAQLTVEALLVGTDTFEDNNVELVSCNANELEGGE